MSAGTVVVAGDAAVYAYQFCIGGATYVVWHGFVENAHHVETQALVEHAVCHA